MAAITGMVVPVNHVLVITLFVSSIFQFIEQNDWKIIGYSKNVSHSECLKHPQVTIHHKNTSIYVSIAMIQSYGIIDLQYTKPKAIYLLLNTLK